MLTIAALLFYITLTLQNLSMRTFTFLTFLAAVPFIAGCGASRPADMVETAPCTITVLQNGSPLSGVVVTLFLEGGNPSLVPRGTTDSSGNAVIRTTLGTYTTDGAPVGTCKVTLNKDFEVPPSPLTPDQISDLNAEQAAAFERERREAADKARIIPASISSIASTSISLTVEAGSGGTLTVDISEYAK